MGDGVTIGEEVKGEVKRRVFVDLLVGNGKISDPTNLPSPHEGRRRQTISNSHLYLPYMNWLYNQQVCKKTPILNTDCSLNINASEV